MGKNWDIPDIAFNSATWAALAEHLHPGAFLFAFGGGRTFHRLACAVGDAGFVLHPALVWLNGNSFPKATRVDTQVGRAAGVKREVIEHDRCHDGGKRVPPKWGASIFDGRNGNTTTAPATPLAATWQGHRYGRQALKPAAEFIVCAQKPYEGKPVDSITATGAGALWVDGARVPIEDGDNSGVWGATQNVKPGSGGTMKGGWACKPTKQHPAGRWPPNAVLSHAAGCARTGEGEWDCAPGCSVAAINGQADNVARFFPQPDWVLDVAERIGMADPALYQAKASRRERNAGCDGMPMRQTTGGGGGVDDYLGDVNSASGKFGSEKAPAYNFHPTVKPLALCRWLATLLLPPSAYAPRRILVPFAGSGSEAIGAMIAGWEHVTAIEADAEYCVIAEARLAWWQANPDAWPKAPTPSDGAEVLRTRRTDSAGTPMLPGFEEE